MDPLENVLGPDHIIYEIVEEGWRATKHTRIGVFCATAPTIHAAQAEVVSQIRSQLSKELLLNP
jgi:hypothetical protein